MRSWIPAVTLLGLAASVPLVHEAMLARQAHQRVADQSQIASLKRQLDDAREALAALEKVGESARIEAERVARLETSLAGIGSQLSGFDARVGESVRALQSLETKATAIERKTSEEVKQTTQVVEAVQADVRTRLSSAEGRLETGIKRLETLEAAREDRDLEALRRLLLTPIVQLSGEDSVGSGVLVFSGDDPDGKAATLVLSSYHVVRNILAESANAKEKGIKVIAYPEGAPVEELAEMLAHDEGSDLVLLRLRGERRYADVARLVSREDAARLTVFAPVYAVGCPLGNDPVPTYGELASLRNPISNHNYWMINAPTYFGNSGGGVFSARTRELVGVFSKIYTHGSGRPTVIPHMGLATPAEAVLDFLDRTGYGYVVKAASARRAEASASRPRDAK